MFLVNPGTKLFNVTPGYMIPCLIVKIFNVDKKIDKEHYYMDGHVNYVGLSCFNTARFISSNVFIILS